jgi:hypothetical protein
MVIKFEVKPVYSIPELATMFKKKYLSMVNLLNKLNIPIVPIGSRHYVYLNDIKEHTPDLYLSLLETIDIHKMQNMTDDEQNKDEDSEQSDKWANGSF